MNDIMPIQFINKDLSRGMTSLQINYFAEKLQTTEIANFSLSKQNRIPSAYLLACSMAC